MHHAQAGQIQPQRQGHEPVHHVLVQVRLAFHLTQKGSVLVPVDLALGTGAAAQVFATMQRVGCVPGDSVEFVVAHDSLRTARVHHAPHGHHAVNLAWPTVYEVAHKDCRPDWMAIGALRFPVTQFGKQGFQFVRLAVDIPNYVICHIDSSLLT